MSPVESQADAAQPTAPQFDADIRRLRELVARKDFATALDAARNLLLAAPESRDLLYIVAVCHRCMNRLPEALATLDELERHHPDYARLYQERGHCHVALRCAPPAIAAFSRAVALNSCLPASWRTLASLYRMQGREVEARNANAEFAKLAALPAPIVAAFSMYADGEIQDAEDTVRKFLLEHGDHVEGMRLLAKIGMDLDVADDAEFLLQNVVRLQPDHHAARYEYALALLKRHKHVQARDQLQILLEIDPNNRVYRTTYATVCTGFGDYDQALPAYRALLAESPQDAELHLSIGHAEKTLGMQARAIEAYRAAAAFRPAFGEAYWSLANLKTYRFTDEEIERMRGAECAPRTRLADRYHLCFALGKAFEDRADYAVSFLYYERGNALKKQECRYRPEPLERNASLQAAVCTREFFAARRGFGCTSAAPIFIVGLPRSGSTLIEQILASHSQVEGTMELADIPRAVQDLQGRDAGGTTPRYPGVLADMSATDFARLGEAYIVGTRVYRKGAPFFVDKMPNNFRHLGLIHLMLPNAKIIDARRDAMACCFSNYKQLFASGQQFTYGIEDIARYYRMYIELMDHWDAALPGRILRVQHEAVVEDLEANVKRILDFCGLPFEPACVQFHATRRTVHTASSEQVRRPINRDGLDQWRHYEPWLAPLQRALQVRTE